MRPIKERPRCREWIELIIRYSGGQIEDLARGFYIDKKNKHQFTYISNGMQIQAKKMKAEKYIS